MDSKTELEYFKTMYNPLDKARKMEDDHGPLKDPKLLEKNLHIPLMVLLQSVLFCMKNIVHSRN